MYSESRKKYHHLNVDTSANPTQIVGKVYPHTHKNNNNNINDNNNKSKPFQAINKSIVDKHRRHCMRPRHCRALDDIFR